MTGTEKEYVNIDVNASMYQAKYSPEGCKLVGFESDSDSYLTQIRWTRTG